MRRLLLLPLIRRAVCHLYRSTYEAFTNLIASDDDEPWEQVIHTNISTSLYHAPCKDQLVSMHCARDSGFVLFNGFGFTQLYTIMAQFEALPT